MGGKDGGKSGDPLEPTVCDNLFLNDEIEINFVASLFADFSCRCLINFSLFQA